MLCVCVCVCVSKHKYNTNINIYACVLVTQSCLTLCNPTDYSPPGSFIHGILQARYWSGLPFPSPGDLPYPGIKPQSPAL